MRSEKQREASRTNGARSRGPKTPKGINISKMNGLKHGLRAAQVVLPGEDAAEFEAELEGWAGDWKPDGHTKAVLVERAAVASWRLRRCVRAEKELLIEIAAQGDDDLNNDDEIDYEVEDRIDRAADDLGSYPARSLAELKALPRGVDRLIALWGDLDEALGDDAEGWVRRKHENLLPLLGHRFDAEAEAVGPLAADSLRLVLDNECEDDDECGGLAGAIVRLRRGIAREVEALRSLRRELVAPAGCVEGSEAARFTGVTPRLMLMHRYEMAHERSLRAAIKDLAALEKARPREGADVVQAVGVKTVKSHEAGPAVRSEAGVAAAPSEPEPEGVVGASGGSRGGRGGLARGSRRRKRRRLRG